MSRKNDFVKLSEGYENWLNLNHLKERTLGFRISENWQEIVGNTIYHHTAKIDVKLPKIYLRIDNSSLKELLYNDRKLIIDKVNSYLNENIVTEIIFT